MYQILYVAVCNL